MGPGMDFMGPMMAQMASAMRVMAQPAMLINAGKIYVAQGGTLYQFDLATLALEKQTPYIPLPPMGPPFGMGMPGMGPPPGMGGPPPGQPGMPPQPPPGGQM